MTVLFLGTVDFPFGMAATEKQMLIGRSLAEQGCRVIFICKKSFSLDNKIPFYGVYNGINYLYTNLSANRYRFKIFDILSWYFGALLELFIVLFLRYDFIISRSRVYNEIYVYSLITKFRGKKFYLTHVEDYRSMFAQMSNKQIKSIERFEKRTWKNINGVFPISEELIRQVKICNPELPVLKIPVLVDLEEKKNAESIQEQNDSFFLFCGSVDYQDTIEKIIQAYEKSQCKAKLILVVNGSEGNMNKLWERVKWSKCNNTIEIKSKLTKASLWCYYINALALLIPLNFNQRDKARFPHKIGEYAASRNLILTSNWGEIPNYFTHLKNAILMNDDIKEFAGYLKMVESGQIAKKSISINAENTAMEFFNYKIAGPSILNFHMSISGNP